MSGRRAWYVACDGHLGEFCGNPAQISVWSLEEARRIARGEGFVRVKVDGKWRDLCPACKDHNNT